MIGLIDMDIFKCRVFVPNPEIMLLSSYFKKKGEVVKLLGSFQDLQYYDKIFIRQNKPSFFSIPEEFYNSPKVDFGGLAFTRGVYVKLPEEVLNCNADPTIYDAFIKCKKWETRREISQKNSLKAHFLSIHNSSAREITNNRAYIIDGDITEKDIDTLNSIQRKTEKQVFHFYYPIHIQDSMDIERFVAAPWFPKNTPPQFICHSHIDSDLFPTLKKYFRDVPVMELVPINPKIHHWEIIPEVEKVINNTIYFSTHEIPARYTPNPQARTGDKMNILYSAAKWSSKRTTKSFEEYCKEDLPLNWQNLTLDDFKYSQNFYSSKLNKKLGGTLNYGW